MLRLMDRRRWGGFHRGLRRSFGLRSRLALVARGARTTVIAPLIASSLFISPGAIAPWFVSSGLIPVGFVSTPFRTAVIASRGASGLFLSRGSRFGGFAGGFQRRDGGGRAFHFRGGFFLDWFRDRDFLEVIFGRLGVREQVHPGGGGGAGTAVADLLTGKPDLLAAIRTFPNTADIQSDAETGAFHGQSLWNRGPEGQSL